MAASFATVLAIGAPDTANLDGVEAYLARHSGRSMSVRMQKLRRLRNALLEDGCSDGIQNRKSGNYCIASQILDAVLIINPNNIIAIVNKYISDSHIFINNILTGKLTVASRPITKDLAICLPIFRRHENIKEAVCSILYQISQMDEFIEVFIGDNFEGDENKKFIDTLLPHFKFLKYIKNPFNLGPDLNFYNLYNQGDGIFKMFVGDDDVVLPGSFSKILENVRNYMNTDINHIFLNFLSTDIDITVRNYTTGFRPADPAKLEMSGEEAVKVVNTELLRMTNSVTRHGPIVDELQRFVGGHYIITLLIALSALTRGRSAVIEAPVYVYREGDRSDWSMRAEWIMNVNVPTAFSVMAEAGYFSENAIAPVFGKMATNLTEWRRQNDLGVVKRERERTDFLLRARLAQQFDCASDEIEICDLRDMRWFNKVLLSNAYAPDYFQMDGTRIVLHPNPPSSDQPISVRFFDIPASFGAELSMLLAAHPQGHAVEFTIVVTGETDGSIAAHGKCTVRPGASEKLTLVLGECVGRQDLVLTTSVVPGAPNHHFCAATFEQLVLISGCTKPSAP